MATSSSMILRSNSNGISLKKIGVQSALPSLTALRQLAPINKELSLNIPLKNNKHLIGQAWLVWVVG
jgi:hypothetical protein